MNVNLITEKTHINVTSFSSIPYWRNSEYWTQKRTQSGNIHSIILDVHVAKQSAQNIFTTRIRAIIWKLDGQLCPVFKSYKGILSFHSTIMEQWLKSAWFDDWTYFSDSKSGLVQYSDHYCIRKHVIVLPFSSRMSYISFSEVWLSFLKFLKLISHFNNLSF